jgi:acetyl-CoA carboxylase biotin carboxyl carrier protein
MSALTRADINEIVELIENSSFTELRIETGDLKIELRRGGAPGSPVVAIAGQDGSASAPSTATDAPAKAAVVNGAETGTPVPAPMLGIFYHAPKPGDDPFVKPGDVVTPDTVIGIIEVMKLMNRVAAGVSGVVTGFVAPSGELVEHGDPLIRVKAA